MQMVGSFAEFDMAIRERTNAGLAQARAEGRIGGRRRKLADKQRREIAESVVSGRKSGRDGAAVRCQRTNGITDRGSLPPATGRESMKRGHDLSGIIKFATSPAWQSICVMRSTTMFSERWRNSTSRPSQYAAIPDLN